jgi:hypothetical protein
MTAQEGAVRRVRDLPVTKRVCDGPLDLLFELVRLVCGAGLVTDDEGSAEAQHGRQSYRIDAIARTSGLRLDEAIFARASRPQPPPIPIHGSLKAPRRVAPAERRASRRVAPEMLATAAQASRHPNRHRAPGGERRRLIAPTGHLRPAVAARGWWSEPPPTPPERSHVPRWASARAGSPSPRTSTRSGS